jgi:uncharacterized membrane protein YdjX (TVP38/TMEM64 family)
MHRRSYRSIRQLGLQGAAGVAVLHLSTTASAGAIHLMCGAGRVPLWKVLLGSAMGLAPEIVVLGGAGVLFRNALLEPTLSHVLAAIGAAVGLVIVAGAMRALLLFRRFAPSMSSHRQGAAFG